MLSALKIIVTGGSGFIGSSLVRRLIAEGHEVVNVDKLTYAANQHSLIDGRKNPRYYFARVDICDSSSVDQLLRQHQPDAIVHLAAETHVDRSITGPAPFVETNVVGTFKLLQSAQGYFDKLPQARREVFRFLHVSTDEVYGSLGFEDSPFLESSPYRPRSPYSASKAASDHFVRAWSATYGLPVIITNSSNNYGPYQFPEKLVPLVILKCLRGEGIPIYGTGENVRDWLFVEDHTTALLRVLQNGKISETYNIGANDTRSNLELVKLICRLLDTHENSSKARSHEQLIRFVPDRPGHDLRYALNTSKIFEELGWRAKEDLTSGLQKTVNWYLENRDWWQPILNQNSNRNHTQMN